MMGIRADLEIKVPGVDFYWYLQLKSGHLENGLFMASHADSYLQVLSSVGWLSLASSLTLGLSIRWTPTLFFACLKDLEYISSAWLQVHVNIQWCSTEIGILFFLIFLVFTICSFAPWRKVPCGSRLVCVWPRLWWPSPAPPSDIWCATDRLKYRHLKQTDQSRHGGKCRVEKKEIWGREEGVTKAKGADKGRGRRGQRGWTADTRVLSVQMELL